MSRKKKATRKVVDLPAAPQYWVQDIPMAYGKFIISFGAAIEALGAAIDLLTLR